MSNSWEGNINNFEISTSPSSRMDYLLKEYPKGTLGNETRSSLLISVAVVIGIAVLSVCVCLVIRSQHALKNIHYKRLRYPHINGGTIKADLDYVVAESADRNEDWFEDDDDDPTEGLLKGRLQIDNSYGNYQTTRITISSLKDTPEVGAL